MSALFFDIDGTILSETTHEIPESALVALRKAQENGHKTFINTGRTICSVPLMIKRIPFDGFLCGCGTHLVYELSLIHICPGILLILIYYHENVNDSQEVNHNENLYG